MNRLSIGSGIFDHEDLWWLIGYLHGDGIFDNKTEFGFFSKDYELIESAQRSCKQALWTPFESLH
jgi:hypothetical protein